MTPQSMINTVQCGDCLEIMAGLPDGCVDLVLTDPPYGVGIDYGDNYDDKRDGYWEWFKPVVEYMVRKFPIVAFTHRVAAIKELSGWDHIAVWNKPLSMGNRLGNSMILPHWEPIFLYGIHSSGVKSSYLPDVITINPERGGKKQVRPGGFERGSINGHGHPVPKPLQLMEKLILGLSSKNQIILDPFCGSGTTLVAAKQLGRRFIGIEINPDYVALSNERLKQSVLDLSNAQHDNDTCNTKPSDFQENLLEGDLNIDEQG